MAPRGLAARCEGENDGLTACWLGSVHCGACLLNVTLKTEKVVCWRCCWLSLLFSNQKLG